MEADMNYGKALLARFGLFAQKDQGPDAFDMRLERIGTRERRIEVRPILFKQQPLLMEA
jgi:hypothetical protein